LTDAAVAEASAALLETGRFDIDALRMCRIRCIYGGAVAALIDRLKPERAWFNRIVLMNWGMRYDERLRKSGSACAVGV